MEECYFIDMHYVPHGCLSETGSIIIQVHFREKLV